MGNICVCPPPGMKKDKPSTQPPDERMASQVPPQTQPQPQPQQQSQPESEQPYYNPSTIQSKSIVASTMSQPRFSESSTQTEPIIASTVPDRDGTVKYLDDKKKSDQEQPDMFFN